MPDGSLICVTEFGSLPTFLRQLGNARGYVLLGEMVQQAVIMPAVRTVPASRIKAPTDVAGGPCEGIGAGRAGRRWRRLTNVGGPARYDTGHVAAQFRQRCR